MSTEQLDLNAIRARAEAATPGPWWAAAMFGAPVFAGTGGEDDAVVCDDFGKRADAEHIAGMDPSTTLTLVAEIEFQRERVDVALRERAEIEAEVERLRGLIRGENVNARRIADALDAQTTAEQERDELRSDHSGQLQWRDRDLATYEMALEGIAKQTPFTTAAIAERALARVAARHQP